MIDDEEIPEWTEQDFAKTIPKINGKRVSKEEFKKAAAECLEQKGASIKIINP